MLDVMVWSRYNLKVWVSLKKLIKQKEFEFFRTPTKKGRRIYRLRPAADPLRIP